jgi:hypothetical protein
MRLGKGSTEKGLRQSISPTQDVKEIKQGNIRQLKKAPHHFRRISHFLNKRYFGHIKEHFCLEF